MTLDLLQPDWPAPRGVQALCSTRIGGVSRAPYASLNLGDHVGDDVQAVAANRQRFQACMGARPIFLRQVHGVQLARLTPASAHGIVADASVSAHPGLPCTVLVADCLPVLFTNVQGTAVAAAHAGWRGLAHGVLEATLLALWQQAASVSSPVPTGHPAAQTLAWLGPCIGPQAFEVGPEVRAAFTRQDPAGAQHFAPSGGGKYLADLAGLARQRLQGLGLRQIFGNDSSLPWCTVRQASRFFSYRRDGVCGRMAASIWLS